MLLEKARSASPEWLLIAVLIYGVNVTASTWRWLLLLRAQHVTVASFSLLGSFLVALFFGNFLPSNIGGDVIRIADTAKAARSRERSRRPLCWSDRGLGLMALVLVAALGATLAGRVHPDAMPHWSAWLWLAFAGGMSVAVPAIFAPEFVARAAAAADRLSSRMGRRQDRAGFDRGRWPSFATTQERS